MYYTLDIATIILIFCTGTIVWIFCIVWIFSIFLHIMYIPCILALSINRYVKICCTIMLHIFRLEVFVLSPIA